MSNLQPLVWKDYGNGSASESRSALHEYDAWKTDNNKGWVVGYFDRCNPTGIKEATGFATIEDAKEWCWNHYNEKMQPYVKAVPTWISVEDRLPEEDGLYFAFYPGSIHERQVISFSSNIKRFNLFHKSVTHWMPLPKPPKGD